MTVTRQYEPRKGETSKLAALTWPPLSSNTLLPSSQRSPAPPRAIACTGLVDTCRLSPSSSSRSNRGPWVE
jgi:hypothetical protein